MQSCSFQTYCFYISSLLHSDWMLFSSPAIRFLVVSREVYQSLRANIQSVISRPLEIFIIPVCRSGICLLIHDECNMYALPYHIYVDDMCGCRIYGSIRQLEENYMLYRRKYLLKCWVIFYDPENFSNFSNFTFLEYSEKILWHEFTSCENPWRELRILFPEARSC